MKRGLASPVVHSALAITRRLRLQLSSVVHMKSLKRRAGARVSAASFSAAFSSRAILATSRSFLASPNTYSTPLSSHHAINSSRANPESALSQISTLGQRERIPATMRATSSREPAAASLLERRSLAASRCRPQKM